MGLTVKLDPELEAFIEEQVSAGYYESASEVVADGLRMLRHVEPSPTPSFDELVEFLTHSIEQAERGETISAEESRAQSRRVIEEAAARLHGRV